MGFAFGFSLAMVFAFGVARLVASEFSSIPRFCVCVTLKLGNRTRTPELGVELSASSRVLVGTVAPVFLAGYTAPFLVRSLRS